MAGQILGRADELRQVFAFLDDDTPRARAVVLCGQAGIGKTTIWRAGVRHAEERGLRTLVAQPAESEAGLPYAALADLFATVTDDALDALPPQQRAAIGAALARSRARQAVSTRTRSLERRSSSWPARRPRAPCSWPSTTCSGSTHRRPRRWPSRLRRLESAPLRSSCPCAPGRGRRRARRSVLESWEQPSARIEVGPLAPTELGALLREALGEDLPRPRVELIARASGGNPMFALELARQPARARARRPRSRRRSRPHPRARARRAGRRDGRRPPRSSRRSTSSSRRASRNAGSARRSTPASSSATATRSPSRTRCSRPPRTRRCSRRAARRARAAGRAQHRPDRAGPPRVALRDRPERKAPPRRSRRPRESRPSSETTPAPPRSCCGRPSSRR